MARTWDSRIREAERNADKRLNLELLELARAVGRVVHGYASQRDGSGEAIVPNRRRVKSNLRQDVWERVVKPYFIGQGSDPLKGSVPQSPYMQTMVGGIEQAITVQAERQVSLIRKHAPDDVFHWLTGLRPFRAVGEMSPFDVYKRVGDGLVFWYDAYHLFVDENGYRLSDKGWRAAQEARQAIDALLDQHIGLGTSAVRIAELLEVYLYPEAGRMTTRTPYGQVGSYWARRLSRTEITAAAGRAMVNMSVANPYVGSVDWALSLSHPCCDVCDILAAGSPYLPTETPAYPAHPHELCTLIPRVASNPAEVSAQLREWMRETPPIGEDYPFDLPGSFNLVWLIAALLGGAFIEEVLGV